MGHAALSPSTSKPAVINRAQPLVQRSAERPAFAAPDALPRCSTSGCHTSLLLATLAYLLALGGAALLNVKTPILDGVPLYLVAAGFLCFWGHAILPRFHRPALLVEAACIVFALGLSLACLSYLGPITDLPLRDTDMIWLDRRLGFDWLQVMWGFDHRQSLLTIMNGAYATFTSQLIGTVLVLIAFKRVRDLDRFFVTFICASVLAELASVLVPTLGPMLTLAKNESFLHLNTFGRATGQIVLALRDGHLRIVDLDAIDGIISFPSLHAAVAVIVPYTLRWNKPLFWPVLALDCVMLASAVPSGDHYLSDVLGGIVVAVLAILGAGRVQQLADSLVKQPTGSANTRLVQAPDTRPSGSPGQISPI